LEAYRVRVPLRWVDMDAQAHINNAHVVDFLQEARVDFLLNSPHAICWVTGSSWWSTGWNTWHPPGSTGRRSTSTCGSGQSARRSSGWATTSGRRGDGGTRPTQLANFDFVAGRPARLAPAERAWFAGRSTDVEEFPSLGEYAVGEAFHEHPIAVRWSDLDSYGHVNNVRFFDYVAEARIAMRESLLQGSITGLGTGDSEHTWMVPAKIYATGGRCATGSPRMRCGRRSDASDGPR
jgi:acyl-CoA thioester hydrolase